MLFRAAVDTLPCARRVTPSHRLHAMLSEVRIHINRHVHSAFWVKQAWYASAPRERLAETSAMSADSVVPFAVSARRLSNIATTSRMSHILRRLATQSLWARITRHVCSPCLSTRSTTLPRDSVSRRHHHCRQTQSTHAAHSALSNAARNLAAPQPAPLGPPPPPSQPPPLEPTTPARLRPRLTSLRVSINVCASLCQHDVQHAHGRCCLLP